jgi:hypothetical protein
MSRLALKLTQPPVQRVPGSLPGGEAAGQEVDQSPSFSTKIKNQWSAPPVYLCDMHRDSLTFLPFNKEW